MTEKNKKYFEKEFQKQMKFIKRYSHSNIGYGEDVMPILNMFSNLTAYEERMSFLGVLEDFLRSPDAKKRNFAVNLCLGFVDFKDAIGK